ncbi:hypothetical protein F5X99DRAFT_431817 [Biscogniauxia marginata]|nr:hypothetical protein F5X99DRAFT_431817 [Biscogniauxia marginata]
MVGEESPTVVGVIRNNDDPPIEKPRDLEIRARELESEERRHLERLQKRRRVIILASQATWDGPDDADDPYNWPSSRRISKSIIISIGQLVAPVSASITVAALDDVPTDLATDPATTQITFSTYFLGLAFGPIPIAAICEMNGRKNIWVMGGKYLVHPAELSLYGGLLQGSHGRRMVSGRYGSERRRYDIYRAKDRGESLAIATILPLSGASSRVDFTMVGAVIIEESYTPVLLRRKAALMREASPLTMARQWAFWHDILSRLGNNLLRPLETLVRRPVIATDIPSHTPGFGIYKFMLSTYATLWVDGYGQPEL